MQDATALVGAIRAAGGLVLLGGAELAAEAGVPNRPETVDWDAYGPRMRAIHAAAPGPGHRAARRLQDAGLLEAVVTESDDVLFDEAGVRDVIALAGSVELSICADCGYSEPLGCLLDLLPRPRCAACGGPLRPDVASPHAAPRPGAMARARAAVASAGLVVVAGATGPGPLAEVRDAATGTIVVLPADAPGARLLTAAEEVAR